VDPPRTLVRFPNWLGDVVMAIPAWQVMRRWADAGHLGAAVPAALAPVASMLEGVDQVVALRSSGHAWGKDFKADVATLRAGRYDRVVLLTNSFGSAWMAARAGVPARWGYSADARRWLLTRAVSRRAPRASPHHSTYYLKLIEDLDIGVSHAPPEAVARLVVGDVARRSAQRLLDAAGVPADATLVGFAPGAAYGTAKRWPPQSAALVIAELTRRPGTVCLLLGAPADRLSGAEVESAVAALAGGARRGAALVNLVGRTDVATLAGVLARCRVAVSNDSGAMHVAAAVGTHVVVPFGPTDERATSPLGPHTVLTAPVFCRPCHLRSCPIDHRCMRRIAPGRVLAEVTRVLDAQRSQA
jgi:heptosyltransferase-2